MPRDIQKSLSQLHARRSGTDRLIALDSAEQTNVLLKSLLAEGWQKRSADKPYTRYALGSMEQVDADYTRISVQTAERVGRQLSQGLSAKGINVDFRLQGSVPLNVHIRGVSDVDLLNLDADFLVYHIYGARSQAGAYQSPAIRTSLEVLMRLRKESEAILVSKFPAADVDVSGSKAIKISGGSLQRPVDVVPSHWFDTIAYQSSGDESVRAVTILDRNANRTIDNYPFLHIRRINENDRLANGGLKKSIRLCKNVKSDAVMDGTRIVLPSFDIAAMMYHSNLTALSANVIYELSVLAETQRFLDWLSSNEAEAKKLLVPDGSRPIFDQDEKLKGLRLLAMEINDLARAVAREQRPALWLHGDKLSLNDARSAISSLVVPRAA